MNNKLTMRLQGKVFYPESLMDAAIIFNDLQTKLLKETGSCMKGTDIKVANKFFAHISQNGSVWMKPAKDWKPTDVPVYKVSKES